MLATLVRWEPERRKRRTWNDCVSYTSRERWVSSRIWWVILRLLCSPPPHAKPHVWSPQQICLLLEFRHHNLCPPHLCCGKWRLAPKYVPFVSYVVCTKSPLRMLLRSMIALFTSQIRHGWKYCWLICCERKLLFIDWKSTTYKPNEQDSEQGLWQYNRPWELITCMELDKWTEKTTMSMRRTLDSQAS